VKKEHDEQKKQLDDCRMSFYSCSPIENPTEWAALLEKVTSAAIKYSEMLNELNNLERKFIMWFFDSFYLFFLDIHVNVHHNALPY